MTESESKLLTGLYEEVKAVRAKIEALHRRHDEHEKEHAREEARGEITHALAQKHDAAIYGDGLSKEGLATSVSKIKGLLNWLIAIAGSVLAAIIIAHFVRR
jgi:hypothetical protein